MAYSISVDPSATVCVKFSEQVTAADLRDGYFECATRTDLPHDRLLLDLSESDLDARSYEMADLSRLPNVFQRIAMLVRTPLAYGLARTYELASGDARSVQVFDDRFQALAWLGSTRIVGGSGVYDSPQQRRLY